MKNWETYTKTKKFQSEVKKAAKEQISNIKEVLFNLLNEAESDIMYELDREHSEKLGEVWGYANNTDTCEVVRDAVAPILGELVCDWIKNRR